MTLLPESILALYRQDADAMISELGVDCRLIYPPTKGEACNNCIKLSSGGSVQNYYRNGGPVYFSMGNCPLCGGTGLRVTESPDEIIKLRINYEPSKWLKLDIPIEIPEGSIQVIGNISNMPKIKKSSEIIINKNTEGYGEEKYSLAGEPIPHGLKNRIYFIAYLSRV